MSGGALPAVGSGPAHGVRSIPLHKSYPAHSTIQTKIRLSIIATALADALGAPTEFKKRFTFPPHSHMTPNDTFLTPAGAWTDDTSMVLCLCMALRGDGPRQDDGKVVYVRFDELKQLEAYRRWWKEGYLSSIGRCFDIGGTIGAAVGIYATMVFSPFRSQGSLEDIRLGILAAIAKTLSSPECGGNGSLMRLLPIPLVFWREDEGTLKKYAALSSRTTHPNDVCVEMCEMWAVLLGRILKSSTSTPHVISEELRRMSKLDVLEYVATYPYETETLRSSLMLALPSNIRPPPGISDDSKEAWYEANYPLLRLFKTASVRQTTATNPFAIPTAKELPSSGYVLHTAIAALYCFLATETFSGGAILAANLGDDSDTVGAVYAGLAGLWYGHGEHHELGNTFWDDKVTEWFGALMQKEMLEQVVEYTCALAIS